MKQKSELTVRCPTCGKEAPYDGNPFRPFCSKRCKLVDLEGWLEERYRISGPANQDRYEVSQREGDYDDT